MNGIVTCNLGTLPEGGSATVALAVEFSRFLLTNYALVRSDQTDFDMGDNSSSTSAATTSVTEEPTMAPPVTSGAVPNPFPLGTRIRYMVPPGGRSAVEIFDPTGHLVRSLAGDDKGSVYWDARDNAGDMVPAGAYFYRVMVHGAGVQDGKIVLVR